MATQSGDCRSPAHKFCASQRGSLRKNPFACRASSGRVLTSRGGVLAEYRRRRSESRRPLRPVPKVQVQRARVGGTIAAGAGVITGQPFGSDLGRPLPPTSQGVWRSAWRRAHLSFCAPAGTFSLTPCFSWGLGDVLTRQPFQRLSAHDKPLKAVARLRPSSPTPLKRGVNERAVNTVVRQRCLLVQKLRRAASRPSFDSWLDSSVVHA